MKRVYFLSLICMTACCRLFAQGVTIVNNGSPVARIITASGNNTQLDKIAEILQAYIEKSSGALLKVVNKKQGAGAFIHLGLTDFAKSNGFNKLSLDDDAFIIKTIGNSDIVILGGSDAGTEFGVYAFLENFLHIRWLMPTELGTDIPTNKTITIPPTDFTQYPAYLSRQLSPIDPGANNPLGVWGRFNRLRTRINFHHNMYVLFDPKSFKNSRPDFYPSVNGKRYVPVNDKDYKWQPNFSARGIVDTASNRIIRYFKSNPNMSSYSLGINDSKNFDESPASLQRRSGAKNFLHMEDVSNDYFDWVNQVAKKVNLVYPNKKFGLLAFNNTAEPPSTTVNPNVIPYITFERMRWSNPALMQHDQELTRKWVSAVPEVGWYDYAYGMDYLVPRVWFHTMQQYLSWGAEHHVKYYYAELYPNWGEGPKAWLLTKLLWQPNQDVDELLADWYKSFGGEKAAPSLKSFYHIWEVFWTKDINRSGWNRVGGQYLPFDDFSYLKDVPKDYITNADKLLNQAYQLADSQQRKQRVGKLLEMWQLYKAAYASYNSSSMFSMGKNITPSGDLTSIMDRLKNDSLHSLSISRINRILNKQHKK